jgi:hypothetical protein
MIQERERRVTDAEILVRGRNTDDGRTNTSWRERERRVGEAKILAGERERRGEGQKYWLEREKEG